jgi:hypothetical protein
VRDLSHLSKCGAKFFDHRIPANRRSFHGSMEEHTLFLSIPSVDESEWIPVI